MANNRVECSILARDGGWLATTLTNIDHEDLRSTNKTARHTLPNESVGERRPLQVPRRKEHGPEDP